ncbi:MAG: hypothetical protein GY803_19525 [Chloroflexi bacterium]|nr:hypothetical protein [Chloroflexota bacterium]
MNFSQVRYARLDREKMAKVRELEESLGGWVVAVEPIATLADLSAEQLQAVKEIEDDLGVVLLAYRSDEN